MVQGTRSEETEARVHLGALRTATEALSSGIRRQVLKCCFTNSLPRYRHACYNTNTKPDMCVKGSVPHPPTFAETQKTRGHRLPVLPSDKSGNSESCVIAF